MGVEFKDYDDDGLPDLFHVTALAAETFPCFRNLGKGTFADATYQSKVGGISIHRGWGLGVFDFNNDTGRICSARTRIWTHDGARRCITRRTHRELRSISGHYTDDGACRW